MSGKSQPPVLATPGGTAISDEHVTGSVAQAEMFLDIVYGDADAPGYLIICTRNPVVSHPFEVQDIGSATDKAIELAENHDVYLEVGLQARVPKVGERGKAAKVLTLPHFWIDIDIAGDAHAKTDLPRTRDEALQLLAAIPFRPTLIIDSGYGLYPIWCFKEPWTLETEQERHQAQSMSRRIQAKIRAYAETFGWNIDNTSSLNQLLRIPGTLNRKLGQVKPVRIIEHNDECRYNPSDFEEILPDEETLDWTVTQTDDSKFNPAKLEPILNGCSFMRHCRDDAATLSEPEWYSMLGIVGRCEDGRDIAHAWSTPYPGYTATETDQKLTHALTAAGPRTCKYIRNELGASEHCNTCPNWGAIKSPITLARNAERENAPPLKRSLNGTAPAPAKEIHRFRWTDTGNAERLVHRHGDRLRFNWSRQVWHFWDGKRWAVDQIGELERLAKETARSIPDEAKGLDEDGYTKTLKWAASSESDGKRQAMIRLARSEPGIGIQAHEMDADPWLLNVENGTLNLKNGTLRPHSPADNITRLVNVPYDPQAICPTFDQFLEDIFEGDAELISYVWRVIGYSLTGSTREQCVLICWGTGANGKSTLLLVIRDLLGDYAAEADAESFMQQKHEAIREDIAALDGARFVSAVETSDGRRLSETLVKKLTGGERLRARRLYENGFEYLPQFKVWLATNHKPEIRGNEHAIWRRIHLIPFSVTIPDSKRDNELPDKLRQELPGILAKAVAGCLEWQRIGLQPPQRVTDAIADYRREMDILADWLEDRCNIGSGLEETAKALFEDYKTWCESQGIEPVKQRTFGIRLTERGCGERREKSKRYRTGIQLKGLGL
jgi:P4 family phage/plasmid primase-like protien